MKAGATKVPKSAPELPLGSLENLSREAVSFVRRYPDKARQAIVSALEKAAASNPDHAPSPNRKALYSVAQQNVSPDTGHRSLKKIDRAHDGEDDEEVARYKASEEYLQLPEHLRPFVIFHPVEPGMLNVTEAASRLEISRTTAYDWLQKKILLGWESPRRGRTIPAEQILGPNQVIPGIPQLLDIIDHPELAWVFLSQEWPFEKEVMRPIDKLKAGGVEEVLASAPGFGTTVT